MNAAITIGRQAVVIGAGMAGLTAARVLADHFERVAVIDRDTLPSLTDPRAGVPQGRHAHASLAGGLRALSELFPGIEGDLEQAGAVRLVGGLDVRVERPGFDPFPQRDLGMFTYSVSRPALELAVRHRVEQLPNVALLTGCRVIDLVSNGKDTVNGVRYDDADGLRRTLGAELVIDASGRGAPTLALFEALGRTPPEETAIGVDIAYATALYEVPPDAARGWKGIMTFPKAPESSFGALMLPLEGGRWMLSLGGRGAEKPPGDEAGFLEATQRLRTPTIHHAICGARRLGDIARYAFPTSVRRHFERLPSFPRGLLPIGDAICVFNPVYGQGMSVAAQEAVLLRKLLTHMGARGDVPARLAPAFFAEVQPVLDTPWAMAAVPDFIFPQTTGPRPPDLERTLKIGAALLRVAARKADVHRLMIEVQHLLKPRSVYRKPLLMAQLMLEMGRG